jgi:hypothetical protein
MGCGLKPTLLKGILPFIECDFVREPRSGGLRRNEQRTGRSACATEGKRAGWMLGVTTDKAHDEERVVVATWAGGWQIRANVGT